MLTKLASHRHRSSVQDQDAAGDAQTGAVEDEQGEDDGPEAWFAPKTVPEPEPHPDYVQSLVPAYAPDFVHAQAADVAGDPLDAYLDGLVSYREAHGYDPDPARLAEHLYTAHGLTAPSGDRPIAPETIRRAWPLLQERFAARFE
jgi:hypothetical protein